MASVVTLRSSVSTDTPFQVVSNFDHFVTQWMSTVGVSAGSATSSSQVHETGSSPTPLIRNDQSSSGVRGVGPADSTGKSRSSYWPGGSRDGSLTNLRRRKPREIGGIMHLFGRLEGRAPGLGGRGEHRGP